MKSIKRIYQFTLLSLCILALTTFALSQNIKNNLAEQAALVTEFEVNGLKVLVKRRPKSSTVATGLFIRGGAKNITAKNAGIESLMLDVASEGSKKYPRETLRRFLSSTGTEIGAGSNNDFSALSMISTRANFEKSWDVFTDVALNPTFDTADIKRVRDRTLTALNESETDNDNFLNILENRVVFKNHPYANEVFGTPETLSKFTANDLRLYHKGLMQTSKLLLVIVGDLDPNQFKTMVEAKLGKLPKGNYVNKPLPEVDFSAPSVDITTRDIPTNYIKGIFKAPSLDNPDYYPMQIAITVLQSSVYNEVRTKRQLSYAPNAEMETNASNTGNIYVTTTSPNEAIKIMLEQMDFLKTRQLNEQFIAGTSEYFLTLHYLDQETNAAQVRELAKYELIGGGWKNSFDFLDKIRAVKPSEIQAASKKYFNNLKFVVIGDEKAIDRKVFLQQGE